MNALAAVKTLLPIRSFSRPARLFLLATIVDGIIYSAWSLFFNFYILSQGYNKDFLGLLNSLPNIAALLFLLPLGMISDRIGRRRAMLLGLAVNTLAMGLQVTVGASWLLLAMVFIGGLGSNLYYVSQAPFMMAASDDKTRSLLFSLNFGVVTLAGAVGALFAGQLPGLFGGMLGVQPDSATAYRAVLLCSVALGSVSLIPIYLIGEAAAGHPAQKGGGTSALRLLARPMVWKIVVPNLCIGTGASILIPYMNVFFAERFHTPDNILGVLFSLSSLLTGIGCVIGPRLAAHWNSKIRTVVVTQGLSLVFLVLMGFTPLGWLAGVSFLARGTFMNMAAPLYTAFSMERFAPNEQGAANSLLNMSWTFGWAVGPYVSGMVQQRFGFGPLFIATTVLYAVAITMAWAFFGKTEQQEKPAAVVGGVELA